MSLFKSTKHQEFCLQCNSPLQIRRGKQGLFLGCSAYPACDYLKPLQQSTHIIKNLDEQCPECSYFLQLKQGHFGIFIGCSNYPNCQFTVHEQSEEEEIADCPSCGKHKLVKRTGRSGKVFYGCKGYPECQFSLFDKPLTIHCPQCAFPLSVQKKVKGKLHYQCADKKCQHIFNENE